MNNDSSVCNPFVITFTENGWKQTVLPMKSQLTAPKPSFAPRICIDRALEMGKIDVCRFSPNDRYLGTISGWGFWLKIWDCFTGNLVCTIGPCRIVEYVFFSCEEILCLIRDGQNYRVEIWNFITLKKVRGSIIENANVEYKYKEMCFLCAATSVCVFQTSTRKLKLFNFETTKIIGEIRFNDKIETVQISPNGRWLAVVTDRNELVFWDLLAFTNLIVKHNICSFDGVHFFNESNQFVQIDFDVLDAGPPRQYLGILRYPRCAYRHIIDLCKGTSTKTKFENFNRKNLASISANGEMISFDDFLHGCRIEHHYHVHALTSNGQILAFHKPNGIINIVDTTTKEPLKSFITKFKSLKRMKFSKNGFVLLVEDFSKDIVQLFSLRDVMMSSKDQKKILCLAKCRHLSKDTIFKIVKEIFIQKNVQQRVSDEYLLNFIHFLKSKAQITCGLSK